VEFLRALGAGEVIHRRATRFEHVGRNVGVALEP